MVGKLLLGTIGQKVLLQDHRRNRQCHCRRMKFLKIVIGTSWTLVIFQSFLPDTEIDKHILIEACKYPHSAPLSPVQIAEYLWTPLKNARVRIKGRSWLLARLIIPSWVPLTCIKAYMLWRHPRPSFIIKNTILILNKEATSLVFTVETIIVISLHMRIDDVCQMTTTCCKVSLQIELFDAWFWQRSTFLKNQPIWSMSHHRIKDLWYFLVFKTF